MPMVTCPCCHGAKRLLVFEPADTADMGQRFGPDEIIKRPQDAQPPMIDIIVTRSDCTHCQGKGVVPAEVEESENVR